MVVGGILYDGGDTLAELCQTLFIDGWRELQELLVLAPLGVADIRRLLLRDEVEDMPLTQTDERLV